MNGICWFPGLTPPGGRGGCCGPPGAPFGCCDWVDESGGPTEKDTPGCNCGCPCMPVIIPLGVGPLVRKVDAGRVIPLTNLPMCCGSC